MKQPLVLALMASLGSSARQRSTNVHRLLALIMLHAWMLLTASSVCAVAESLASFVKTTLMNAFFSLHVRMGGYALIMMAALSASVLRDSLTHFAPLISMTASSTTAQMEPPALTTLHHSPVSVWQGTLGHSVSRR